MTVQPSSCAKLITRSMYSAISLVVRRVVDPATTTVLSPTVVASVPKRAFYKSHGTPSRRSPCAPQSAGIRLRTGKQTAAASGASSSCRCRAARGSWQGGLEEVAKELCVVEFENSTGRDVAEEDHRNDGQFSISRRTKDSRWVMAAYRITERWNLTVTSTLLKLDPSTRTR